MTTPLTGRERAGVVARLDAAADARQVYAAAYGMLRAELASAVAATDAGDGARLRWALRRARTVEQVVEDYVTDWLAPSPDGTEGARAV